MVGQSGLCTEEGVGGVAVVVGLCNVGYRMLMGKV